MNDYARLRRRLREATTCGHVPNADLLDILDEALGALARDLDPQRLAETIEERIRASARATIGHVTRAAAEIDRLARAGTPCMIAGQGPAAIGAMVALGWEWQPHRRRLVMAEDVVIPVASTTDEARGGNIGALWLASALPAVAKQARYRLRVEPRLEITTGMVDQSNPAGVDPVIRETDKTDPPSESAPVLPPGCRLEPFKFRTTTIQSVTDRYDHEVAQDQDLSKVVARSWERFGRFMSREDYEALVGAAARVQPWADRDAAVQEAAAWQERHFTAMGTLGRVHDALRSADIVCVEVTAGVRKLAAERDQASAEAQRLRGLAESRAAEILAMVDRGPRIPTMTSPEEKIAVLRKAISDAIDASDNDGGSASDAIQDMLEILSEALEQTHPRRRT